MKKFKIIKTNEEYTIYYNCFPFNNKDAFYNFEISQDDFIQAIQRFNGKIEKVYTYYIPRFTTELDAVAAINWIEACKIMNLLKED